VFDRHTERDTGAVRGPGMNTGWPVLPSYARTCLPGRLPLKPQWSRAVAKHGAGVGAQPGESGVALRGERAVRFSAPPRGTPTSGSPIGSLVIRDAFRRSYALSDCWRQAAYGLRRRESAALIVCPHDTDGLARPHGQSA